MLNIHVTLSLDKRSLSMSLAGISQRRPLSCQWHAYSPTTLPPFTKITNSVDQIKIREAEILGKCLIYNIPKSEPFYDFFLVDHIADKDIYNHAIILIYRTGFLPNQSPTQIINWLVSKKQRI